MHKAKSSKTQKTICNDFLLDHRETPDKHCSGGKQTQRQTRDTRWSDFTGRPGRHAQVVRPTQANKARQRVDTMLEINEDLRMNKDRLAVESVHGIGWQEDQRTVEQLGAGVNELKSRWSSFKLKQEMQYAKISVTLQLQQYESDNEWNSPEGRESGTKILKARQWRWQR